ncbi:ribonuclease J [Acidaminobacter hydrogenoformans]|uniref:Ribonuclease J n=1 Tax=Acidaminobacter hydrogenoformans DSM 2784 TaxID=1120920 RepID=A0A1G5S6L5_9FIRM|nr:ribonuclease J [Acidaminobacter hydrogenoformans]SCZ81747.1 ribonuclease J [Acidaminobacter hydrogenoformans DSM 2784]
MVKTPHLKVMPLGGMNEIGKNMTAYQYENDIIVVDAGLAFPDDDMLGIDIVIPDITFLKKNQDKIRGLVYTHGHEDHIGATPYVLKQLSDLQLYGSRLTMGLIENKLKEHKGLGKHKKNVVKAGDVVQLGAFEVEFIHVSHSIPDAFSLAIKTPVGTVIQTGDFKIDFTPIDGLMTDLPRFAQLGSEGVLALFADSTNVERPGFTMSERTVGETFEEIFHHSEGRIIVASFSSNVHRVQQIINSAMANGRKVAFAGRSMINVSTVSLELGYLNVDDDTLIDLKDIDRYPDNEITIITTGSQGEPMSGLSRMATNEHRQVEIRQGDLVVLSSSPIPGNEKSVTRIINLLYEKGANVIYNELADVHTSGHACEGELKLIHALVKPKFFVPFHGEYNHLRRHAQMAEEMGIPNENIFIMRTGDTLEFSRIHAKFGKPVPSGNVMIDGLGVGDVGNVVLRDRKHLAEDGLMIVVVAIRKDTGEMINAPDIISRGFVYVRESEELMNGARDTITATLNKSIAQNVRDWTGLKSSIRDALRSFLYEKTRRSPMILPVIIEV